MLLQTECEGERCKQAQQVISDWRGSWAGLSGGGDRGEDAVQVGYHPEHCLPPPHLIMLADLELDLYHQGVPPRVYHTV